MKRQSGRYGKQIRVRTAFQKACVFSSAFQKMRVEEGRSQSKHNEFREDFVDWWG